MGIRGLILSLLITSALVSGCVSVNPFATNDPIDRELARIETTKIGEAGFVTETGLTQEGCSFIFPDKNPEVCITLWRSLEPTDRLLHLQENGSKTVRSMLQVRILTNLSDGIRGNNPEISDTEMEQVLDEIASGNLALSCIESAVTTGESHPDVCIFLFGRLASPEEVADVLAHVATPVSTTTTSDLVHRTLWFNRPESAMRFAERVNFRNRTILKGMQRSMIGSHGLKH